MRWRRRSGRQSSSGCRSPKPRAQRWICQNRRSGDRVSLPDGIEADRFLDCPHPREQADLFGHAAAETAFLDAFRSGRLHHAWLIGGPQGIGKATFAYRAARFLLANPDPSAPAVVRAVDLRVDPDNPVARKVAALSHPDLVVLRRTPGTDKKGPSASIPIDAVRRALAVFGTTAGAGGYRVAIVDSVEDLNAASANALLKVVEEPPPRSVFLIVAHAPGRTMATLRSRCRKMIMRPLGPDDVAAVLAKLDAHSDSTAVRQAAAMADGSVRTALRLIDPDVSALVERVRRMLARLPDEDVSDLYGLADQLSGRADDERFATFLTTVGDWIGERVHTEAAAGASRLAPLVEVWDKGLRAARDVQVLNLDRRPFVFSLIGDLAEAVRRSSAA
ncbi:MAG: DNA polymerase III subunit delta' [Chelatococcus sp.]|nr:DNA polymerase III subunit delta' [Chelatococcus sp. HY11]MBX3543120.1 DNA polymerase III subunit delta' [Chelatococcus sp.]